MSLLYNEEFFEHYLKFERDIKKEMKSFAQSNSNNKKEILEKLYSIRKKKPISDSVIKMFYEQPEQFFKQEHKLLENTTFFDFNGNSIFSHYFYILFESYKRRNNIEPANQNDNSLKFEIYESKFDSFFNENERYLLIQDVNLDTPLHKIARRKDKGFFIEIYQKLKKINLINNELLLTKNLNNEHIYNYIIDEIKNNYLKAKNVEFYYNFIKENKAIFESLSDEDKKLLTEYTNKILFDIKQYKEENFDEIFNNIKEFINNNKNDPHLFEYIYYPFTSNINYLNFLFSICSKKEDYEKLFNLVSLLKAKYQVVNKICISELCIMDHIKYVLRKMYLYNRKAEDTFNYGFKLIKEILANILKNKKKKEIIRIIGRKRFKRGLISNIVYNNSLTFDKKYELLKLLSQLTNGLSDKYIEKNTALIYNFLKLCEGTKIAENNVIKLAKNNKSFKRFIANDIYIIKLININLKAHDIVDLVIKKDDYNYNEFYDSSGKKIQKVEISPNNLIEFLNKNHLNIYKIKYNLSNEKIEKIISTLYLFRSCYNKLKEKDQFKYTSEKIDNLSEYIEKIEDLYSLSDKNITEYYLNLWMKNDKYIGDLFFQYLFSSENDYSELILHNDVQFNLVKKLVNNYLYEEDEDGEKDINESMISKFPKYSSLIKGKPFESNYYAVLSMISSMINRIDIMMPVKKSKGYFEKLIKDFNKMYMLKLIKFWDEPFDFSEVVKTINFYILPFFKLYINNINMIEVIMKELDNNLNIDPYIKALKIQKEFCNKYGEDYVNECLGNEIPEDDVNDLFFTMILIYLKKKYEKENPKLIVFLLTHLISSDKKRIIDGFSKLFKEQNSNSINFLNYFSFKEPVYSNEKYKVVDYLKNNNIEICKILNNFRRANYNTCKDYIKFIKPFIKGYAYFEDENNYKPYYNRSEFSQYYKSHEINIRFLVHFDLTKRDEILNKEENKNEGQNGEENENEKEEEDYICNYNTLIRKIYKEHIPLYSILDESPELLNKHLFNQIISIIDNLSRDSLDRQTSLSEINEENIEINKNICFNLYQLLLCLKETKRNIISILNNNKTFIKKTSNFFSNIYFFFRGSSNEEKKKIEFVKNEIMEYINTVNDVDFIELLKTKDSHKIEILNSFINKIKNIKDINKIKNEYYEFIKTPIDIYNSEIIDLICNIFEILIETCPEVCIDYLRDYLNNIDVVDYSLIKILKKMIKKNIINFINNYNDILSTINNFNESKEFKIHNYKIAIEKILIKSIIENKKWELFFNDNIKNYTNIVSDFESSLLILNNIDNSSGSKYMMNKIKELFCNNDDVELFIGCLKYLITNEYVIETLIKVISKKKDRNIFETNKDLIFGALYEYSEKNEYYTINALLDYAKENMSLDVLKRNIYPDLESTNRQEIKKNNYLFFYSLSKKVIPNYETIAVLLNYCPQERAILEMFPNIYSDKIMTDFKTIQYLRFFSNSKNRDNIKSLNKFFYNFSLFLESFEKQRNSIDSLDASERTLFAFYIKIIILQITPLILLVKNENPDLSIEIQDIFNKLDGKDNELSRDTISKDDESNEVRNNKDKICSELEFCMILALYEIRGTPLIPIKKYLPEFYNKIENYCKKFKSFKISEICLKNSFDIKFFDYFLNNIKNNTLEMIDKFTSNYNIIFILQNEYGYIFEKEELTHFQKAVYNLIKNNNIISFNDNDEKNDEFYNTLNHYKDYYCMTKNIPAVYEGEMSNIFIKECIFSLKDFNRSSSSIIQKCVDNYSSSKTLFYDYICYLRIISSICIKIISSYNNPFENNPKNQKNNTKINEYDIFILRDNLFQNDNSKLTALKNSINFGQIKYCIIEGLKKLKLNEMDYFDLAINWIDFYLKQKNIIKMFNDLSTINFNNYFNYLYLSCQIIIDWLKNIENIIIFNDSHITVFNMKIRLIQNSNVDNAKKDFGVLLFNIGLEMLRNIRSEEDHEIHPTINMFYYFDENLGDYVETCSGKKLFNFMKEKYNSIGQYFDRMEEKGYIIPNLKNNNGEEDIYNNELLFINDSINNKEINLLYLYFTQSTKIDKNSDIFVSFRPILEPLLKENKDFIALYMKNTASNSLQPNYNDCLELIKYKFLSFFSSYIYPCLSFNYNLTIFCENIYDMFPKDLKYKIYVDFSQIINSIRNTKYHKDDKLNELFKIKAINYIINGDSLINIFINEIYKFKSDEMKSRIGQFGKRGEIKDKFTIKIVEGKKIGKSEFDNLKKVLVYNNFLNDVLHYSKIKLLKSNPSNPLITPQKKKKVIYKLKNVDNNSNNFSKNSVYFSAYKNNRYKRENIPLIGYQGFIPNTGNNLGKSNELIINETFGSALLKSEKNGKSLFDYLGLERKENLKIRNEKMHKAFREKYVNVFDFIFSVKSINRNEIVLYNNNISSILDQYYEPKLFRELLNYSFPPKKVTDVIIDMDMIQNYVNENP